MKKYLPIIFAMTILTGLSVANFDSAFAETPNYPPPGFKVAFIGDQGSNSYSEKVLQLIKDEGADMVLHQGDFDYGDRPDLWDNRITSILGENFPYFASVGNHDERVWNTDYGYGTYQQKLQERLDRIPEAVCIGDLGRQSACHFNGLFFILSGVGTMDHENNSKYPYLRAEYVAHIQNELANDDSIWSICSWHKNQNAMQIGTKGNEVGWGAYEACRQGGAIIATAHEHTYERTKTLTSTTNQIVDPAWSDPDEVRVAEDSTFVFVSGLGGHSVRNQDRCTPYSYPYGCNGEWANIYTSNQNGKSGALFCSFNVDGQVNKASCYFKNHRGEIPDTFNITSFMGIDLPQEPPIAFDQSVSTLENNSIDITLSASDVNGDSLTYSIVSDPSKGSLSGSGQTQTYTPNPNYDGLDSFTFKANDGTDDSNLATVSITVDPIPTSGILDIRISASADDAEQRIDNGFMDISSSDIEIGDNPGANDDQLGGLRFNNVIVPQGAEITNAYIEFETDETGTILTSVIIRAQDSDNSEIFSSDNFNISNRPTTTSLVSWDNIPEWNTINEKHSTPDLSLLVQEVVDREGWIFGNSLVFIIDGTGTRTAESYDGESLAAPLLHIEYNNTSTINNLPTADAGIDQNVDENTNVILDGTGSSDSDGTVDTYAWTQIAGIPVILDATIPSQPTFTAPEVGPGGETLIFSLIVTDDDGESSITDTVDINVSDIPVPNTSPTTTGIGDYIVLEDASDTEITLTSHFDDAEDGPTGLTYTVLSNDNLGLVGTSISGGTLTLSYVNDAYGESNITIRATDSGSLTVDDTFNVKVVPENDTPTVTINSPSDDSTFTEGDSVIFSGSASDVEDGDISSSIQWISDLDELIGNGSSFNIDILSVGTHLITAQVTDSGNNSVSDTIAVTIGAAPEPNSPPEIISATYSPIPPISGNLVTLTGTATDSDGDDLTYQWVKISGPKAHLSDEDTANAKFTPDVKGKKAKTWVFQLTVTDLLGASATAEVSVTVNP